MRYFCYYGGGVWTGGGERGTPLVDVIVGGNCLFVCFDFKQ